MQQTGPVRGLRPATSKAIQTRACGPGWAAAPPRLQRHVRSAALPAPPALVASMRSRGATPLRPARTPWPRPIVAPPTAVAAWLGTLDDAHADGTAAAKAAAPGKASLPPQGEEQQQQSQPFNPQQQLQQQAIDVPTLVHQRFRVRAARYAAPLELQTQAGQIVGLLFTLLGPPTFKPAVPGLRHPTTEGKYDLLRLLWRRAERAAEAAGAADTAAAAGESAPERAARWAREEEEDAAKEAAIAASMTFHLRESLRKVLANPDVPQEARDIASARLRDREASVKAGLAAWFDTAAVRDDFGGVVLPLLRAVMRPLEAAGGYEPTTDGRGGPASAANGERMEARSAAAVAAQLPPGWSLLSQGHVVALDGRHPGHYAACKWEVDFVALDETGTAVALFEAKLANANPLMTLLTDVERCIALCDQLAAAETVTLRVRADKEVGSTLLPATAAAATASVIAPAAPGDASDAGPDTPRSVGGSSVSGGGGVTSGDDESDLDTPDSELPIALRRKRRKAEREATKARKLWRDITVRVDPRLAPVYVLGRPLRRKDLRRGLASCASAEALKLASRDPAALAAALGIGAASGGDGGDVVMSDVAPEALVSASSVESELSETLSRADSEGSTITAGSTISSGSGSGPSAAVGEDGTVRLTVHMPEEWRQHVRESVLSRLDLITSRCTVLAIDDGATVRGA